MIKLQLGDKEEDVPLTTVYDIFTKKRCDEFLKPKKILAHEINQFSFQELNRYINTYQMSGECAVPLVIHDRVAMQRWNFAFTQYTTVLGENRHKSNKANSTRESTRKKLDFDNPYRPTKTSSPKVLQEYEFIVGRDVHMKILQLVFPEDTPQLPHLPESLEFLRYVGGNRGNQCYDRNETTYL